MRQSLKLIILCVSILIVRQSAYAQARNAYLYMQVGGGWGSFNTLNIGATVMYKKFALTYDYIGQRRRADNVPADYSPGLTILDDGYPRETIQGSCIEGARVVYFAGHKLRVLARGGLFLGSYTRPDHFARVSTGGFNFGPNYQTDWQTRDVVGITLHPTTEWPGAVPFGLSSGVRIVITGVRSSAAIDFNLLLGKVRKSRRRAQHLKQEHLQDPALHPGH